MTNEYISKQDALKGKKTGTFANGICFVAEPCVTVEYIESLEPADVVPLVHGEWINEYWHSETVRKCSVCHITQTVNVYEGKVKFNYCPYCGAKMDAQGEE